MRARLLKACFIAKEPVVHVYALVRERRQSDGTKHERGSEPCTIAGGVVILSLLYPKCTADGGNTLSLSIYHAYTVRCLLYSAIVPQFGSSTVVCL